MNLTNVPLVSVQSQKANNVLPWSQFEVSQISNLLVLWSNFQGKFSKGVKNQNQLLWSTSTWPNRIVTRALRVLFSGISRYSGGSVSQVPSCIFDVFHEKNSSKEKWPRLRRLIEDNSLMLEKIHCLPSAHYLTMKSGDIQRSSCAHGIHSVKFSIHPIFTAHLTSARCDGGH